MDRLFKDVSAYSSPLNCINYASVFRSGVRKTIIEKAPLTPYSLPFLLQRARDVDASCRLELYRTLRHLPDYHVLSIQQRDELLQTGFIDRFSLPHYLTND